MLGMLPLVALLASAAPTHETAVQRHHRKGVHCMEVIERVDCAIEQFELVLDEDTRERELVTDAMVRLIQLYRKQGDDDGQPPIFSEMPCVLAERLGQDGTTSWTRIAGAVSHQDGERSMMLVDIPGVLPLLAKATAEGRVREIGVDHWVLQDVEYAGQPVHILRADLDQVILAREDMLAPVLEAKTKRRRRMNRELERLAQQVPRDSSMIFAMTQAAVVGTGFGGLKQGAATVLQALLPKPKGLQVSVSTGDVAGVFTRVPTNNAVKGRMLVNIVRSVLAGQAQDDPEVARWMEGLDIAEAGDRRALLAAYLIDAERMAEMMWD
jgi:hypothetical protein